MGVTHIEAVILHLNVDTKIYNTQDSVLVPVLTRDISLGHIREFDISPPDSVPKTTGLFSESKGISLHICSFINQQLQAITSV